MYICVVFTLHLHHFAQPACTVLSASQQWIILQTNLFNWFRFSKSFVSSFANDTAAYATNCPTTWHFLSKIVCSIKNKLECSFISCISGCLDHETLFETNKRAGRYQTKINCPQRQSMFFCLWDNVNWWIIDNKTRKNHWKHEECVKNVAFKAVKTTARCEATAKKVHLMHICT